MNIVKIEEMADGNVLATVADDNGNIIGVNIYGPESYPRPEMGTIEEAGVFRRIWRWVSGG